MLEIKIVKSLIASYFEIVKQKIADTVPKCIIYTVVVYCKNVLHAELTDALFKPDLFAELLQEADEISEKRRMAKTRLDLLQQALTTISQVRDYEAV